MNQLHTEFLALPPYVLLLSRFSRVRLCSTPQMAAHQAPPSLGFSSQELWNGLSFPSPMNESESKVTQSCPTLSNPMDFSLPGSSVRGIFQARVLEWVAIASLCTLYQFSNFNKENVHRSIYIYIYTLCFPIMYHCLSRKLHWWFSRYVISDSCDPMDCSHQAPLLMKFSRQEC